MVLIDIKNRRIYKRRLVGKVLNTLLRIGSNDHHRKPEDESLPTDDNHKYWTVQYKLKNRDAIVSS